MSVMDKEMTWTESIENIKADNDKKWSEIIEILASCEITLEMAEEALEVADSYLYLPTMHWIADSGVLTQGKIGCITEGEWLSLLGRHWIEFDNIHLYLDDLLDEESSPLYSFVDYRGLPVHAMMDDDEQAAYEALPDEITVYRGCYKGNIQGLSWTLDAEVAKKFPSLVRYRQKGQPLLVKAMTKKKDIIAVKSGRKESEIITYKPKHISTSHIPITWNNKLTPSTHDTN